MTEKLEPKIHNVHDKSSESGPPKGKIFVLLFGIILPIVAPVFELATQICADTFFDPLPTFWHFLIFILIPLSNLFCWLTIWRNNRKYLSKLRLINGVGIGLSLIYTVQFIPITLISIIGIIFFGIGLFGLAPLLSFISAIICFRRLKKRRIPNTNQKFSKRWHGIAIGISLFVMIETPLAMTYLGMEMAASDDAESQTKGIRILRVFGSENTMLKICYRPVKGFIFPTLFRVSASEARKIYYRVTGTPFNKAPRPRLSRSGWEFDGGRGRAGVAGKVNGLSLSGSRIDGVIHSDAGLSYLEWTLVFENRSGFQQEARARILLPPGGVVSRVTLWINGEEREAAFAGKSKVREAYEQIVRQSRDPLLVTTEGNGNVLAQCFPVPDNGEMKIRIGITSPLRLAEKENGFLRLPCFTEQNFTIPENIRHSVWIESEKPLEAANKRLRPEHPKDTFYALRGIVSDPELSVTTVQIHAARDAGAVMSWTPDPVSENRGVIRQIIKETDTACPSRIIVVVDGSRSMRKFIPAIAESFRHLPDGIECGFILASDLTTEMVPLQKGNIRTYRNAGNRLKEADYEGGQDNISALARAWEIASGSKNSVILWIHGVQPVLLQSIEVLQQKWDRRPDSVRLLDMQIINGPNRILEKLNLKRGAESVSFSGNAGSDLKNLFSEWSGNQKRLEFFRERISAASGSDPDLETSSHLARLWAYSKILDICFSDRKQAIQLATDYQLVTRVSGAVVLETERQYEEADLKPADSDTVPNVSAVPEPATLWLMLAGLLSAILIMSGKKTLLIITESGTGCRM